MLARFLRLSLLFESFAYLLLGVGLVRLSGWSPWAALLLAIVLALAGRAGVVTFSYLNAYVHRHAAGGGRGPQWQEVAREIWAFVASIFVEAFDTLLMRADAPRRVADGAHEAPLLLVHGYGCNRGYWWWLKPRLEARGRSVATLSLEPIHGDIDAYAEQIARRVAWLRERSGAQRVTLVGHSMGGLACLAYLRRYGEDSVAKLITLGTQHCDTHGVRAQCAADGTRGGLAGGAGGVLRRDAAGRAVHRLLQPAGQHGAAAGPCHAGRRRQPSAGRGRARVDGDVAARAGGVAG